jgi:hypothetical protein
MSYLNNPPNINETFIIESTELTPTITACTGVYTNEVISCDSDTSILLTPDELLINKSILPKVDATIDAGTPAFRFREINSVISNLNTLNATGGTITTLDSTTLNLGNLATYNGLSDVSGKFLSGTTNGFVLNSISAITGVDTYVTGFTYGNNVATIKRNQNQDNLSILINTMTGLTVTGILSAITSNATTSNVNTINAISGTITTLRSTTANINTLNATGGTVTTLGSTTANLGTANITTLNASDGIITTLDSTTLNLGNIASYSGLTNLAGQFLSGTTNGFALAPISGITGIDTYVTGFTYSPTTNTITLKQNQNQPNKTLTISTVSGLTVSNLNPNYLVYTTTGGKLITNSSAFFNGVNMILPSSGSLKVGTGGLTVGSNGIGDVVINGSLTVFGPSVSAFTSNLYVEDNNITLNYNPTGNTIATSIGAGWTIQDGNGINGGDVSLDIRSMDTFTGLTSTEIPTITEYIGSTGYSNRAWVTQLNDIVIRSTNPEIPNGVRLLAEFDVLDGGFF